MSARRESLGHNALRPVPTLTENKPWVGTEQQPHESSHQLGHAANSVICGTISFLTTCTAVVDGLALGARSYVAHA
jgi:hypothetical protein